MSQDPRSPARRLRDEQSNTVRFRQGYNSIVAKTTTVRRPEATRAAGEGRDSLDTLVHAHSDTNLNMHTSLANTSPTPRMQLGAKDRSIQMRSAGMRSNGGDIKPLASSGLRTLRATSLLVVDEIDFDAVHRTPAELLNSPSGNMAARSVAGLILSRSQSHSSNSPVVPMLTPGHSTSSDGVRRYGSMDRMHAPIILGDSQPYDAVDEYHAEDEGTKIGGMNDEDADDYLPTIDAMDLELADFEDTTR